MGCPCTKRKIKEFPAVFDTCLLHYVDRHHRLVTVPFLKPLQQNKLYSSRIEQNLTNTKTQEDLYLCKS